MSILDKKYKSPIVFLGKPRELAKTTKRTTNKIRSLLKRDAEMNRISSSEEYDKASELWIKDSEKLVKSLISPISKEELEEVDVMDIKCILDAIERRKYVAAGYTHEEVDLMEASERANVVGQAKLMVNEVEKEDFLKKETPEPVQEDSPNTDPDMNTG